MGEKKGKKNHNGGEKTKPKDKAGEDGSLKVVLKVDMHCEGCARKVKRSVEGFEGVESVEADNESSKLTVVGKVDPWKLRERVEQKTHKKVTLVSPTDYPKEKKVDKQEKGDIKQKKNSDEPKPKPKPKPPVASTVVLNILLHCEGCIQRIRRSISKVKGVDEVLFDAPKDLVIVKGIMDVKSMVPFLQNKFKRKIVIIQAAAKKDDGDKKNGKAEENEKDKDKEGDDDAKKNKVNSDEKKKNGKDMSGGGEKKGKKGSDGGGEKEKQDGGGEKKEKKGSDGGGGEKKEKEKKDDSGGEKKEKKDGGGGEGKMESSKMEYYSGGYVPYEQHYYHHQQYQQYQQYQFPQQQQQYHHHQQQYYPALADMAHAPQMFSDENPNACSIM